MRRTGPFAIALLVLAGCARPVVPPAGVSDTPAHHWSIGMTLLQADDSVRAERAFNRAIALDPAHAPAYEGLGLVALARRDLDQAVVLFTKSVAADRKYAPAHLGLARVYLLKGQYRRASTAASDAQLPSSAPGRHPLYGELLVAALVVSGEVQLSEFAVGNGTLAFAEGRFARALEIDPTNREARRAWERSVRIRQAAPGTLVGKRVAIADPVKRGELAALLVTELGIEREVRKRRPEVFDRSFTPPGKEAQAGERMGGVGGHVGAPHVPTDIVAHHWARQAIELVSRLGVMEAYPDGTFRPEEPVTRVALASTLQHLIAVLANDLALKTRFVGQASPFPDVRGDHFAFNAVMVVTTRGLMEAERPTGAFRLTTPVSGAEALLAMRKLTELF